MAETFEQLALKAIGFVGVGRMGSNMAARLQSQGFSISGVFDRNVSVAQKVAQQLNTQVASSLSALTACSDAIITVVSDDAAMADIYENSSDNLLINSAGKLFINCATISPQVHIHLHAKAQQADAHMLECPMASSIQQAKSGSLFLMCAGDVEVFERAQPILKALASSVTYTGKPGTAAQVKALVNMVMNINTAGLAEGLGLADSLGLDLTMVRDIFSKTGAQSRVLETDADDMQNRDHETYFSAAHAAKDSGIALALAEKAGLKLPLAQATYQQYRRMIELGLGELDKSGVSELTFPNRVPAEPVTQ